MVLISFMFPNIWLTARLIYLTFQEIDPSQFVSPPGSFWLTFDWDNNTQLGPLGSIKITVLTWVLLPEVRSGIQFTKLLWAHDWNLCEHSLCFYQCSNDSIRSQTCTCHDSWAVMTCAKLWPNLSIIFEVGVKLIFTRFQLWAYKPFAKWVPGRKCFVGDFVDTHWGKWLCTQVAVISKS